MDSTVYKWDEIATKFTDGLILGNGASIAFDPRFNYTSLRSSAQDMELFADDVDQVFEYLKTADFELVLRMLWHASKINEALAIDEQRTPAAYENVRDALIKVVQAVHVTYSDVADRLAAAAKFMLHFETVASLSYDLLVYWAVMLHNAGEPNRFKDCFLKGRFECNWTWLRDPFGQNKGTTLILYPHGNLALAADIMGDELKIATDPSGDLLAAVFDYWRSGEFTPVFVSEGTSTQKLAAIRRSIYLSTVYHEMLPDMGESLVLFGWSMGDHDLHLVDATCHSGVRRFAAAVNPDDAQLAECQARIDRLISERHKGADYELYFFDRASSGCWITP